MRWKIAVLVALAFVIAAAPEVSAGPLSNSGNCIPTPVGCVGPSCLFTGPPCGGRDPLTDG